MKVHSTRSTNRTWNARNNYYFDLKETHKTKPSSPIKANKKKLYVGSEAKTKVFPFKKKHQGQKAVLIKPHVQKFSGPISIIKILITIRILSSYVDLGLAIRILTFQIFTLF